MFGIVAWDAGILMLERGKVVCYIWLWVIIEFFRGNLGEGFLGKG
jgi:hypothetical protein